MPVACPAGQSERVVEQTIFTAAGGLLGINHVYKVAKPDGLTIMQDSSSSVASFARGGPSIKYDPRKFKLIGGVARSGSLLMIRNDARARFTNKSAKPAVVGDTEALYRAAPASPQRRGAGGTTHAQLEP